MGTNTTRGPIGILALAAIFLALGGCTTLSDTAATARKGPLYWPPLPAQPRFVYETDLRDSNSIRAESETDRFKRLVTGKQQQTESFTKPFAVAARQGSIYVSDTEDRVIYVFDVPLRKFYAFGYRPKGHLEKPMAIALDGKMNVYVADATERRIMVYDHLGLFEHAIGSKQDLDHPVGVAVNRAGTRVYVVDAGDVENEQHRVVVYDGSGKKLFTLGKRGSAPGEFNFPVAAATAPDGTLYVLDAGNFRVQAFTPDGKFLRSFGSLGNAFGQFARPRGIAVDDDGNVYVSDAKFGNVQIFNGDGELLLTVGERSLTDGPGKFLLPAGVAVDETGRLYVVDQFFHKVEVIRRISDAEGRRIVRANRSKY